MRTRLIFVTLGIAMLAGVAFAEDHYHPATAALVPAGIATVVSHPMGPGLIVGTLPRGRVVEIANGDTLTVLETDNQRHVIRLSDIDAPESKQAFGQQSKRNLSRLVLGKQVTLNCASPEFWGREICKVRLRCDAIIPMCEDIGLRQVRDGMAWDYKQYEDWEEPAERLKYAAAEGRCSRGASRPLERSESDRATSLPAPHTKPALLRPRRASRLLR